MIVFKKAKSVTVSQRGSVINTGRRVNWDFESPRRFYHSNGIIFLFPISLTFQKSTY